MEKRLSIRRWIMSLRLPTLSPPPVSLKTMNRTGRPPTRFFPFPPYLLNPPKVQTSELLLPLPSPVSSFAISLRRNFIYFAWMGEAADPCERFPGNRENPRGISETNFPNVAEPFLHAVQTTRARFNLWLDRLRRGSRELPRRSQRETRLDTQQPLRLLERRIFPGSRATRPQLGQGFRAVVVENTIPYARDGFRNLFTSPFQRVISLW